MFTETLDDFRTWPTERLREARDDAAREERRWTMRRIAMDRVLDERRATDGCDAVEWVAARDGIRTQQARAEVEVARALEELPVIAAAAEAGDLSMAQLESLVQLATPATDAAWAARGKQAAPSDLARMVRRHRVVSPEEMEARREAREFRWWRSGEMLQMRGAIPDLDGVVVESVFEHLIEQLRPAKGEGWETRAHRGADALVGLCRDSVRGVPGMPEPSLMTAATSEAVRRRSKPRKRPWAPTIVIHMGSEAQPSVAGVPLAVETVQALIDDGSRVREIRDDDPLAPATGDAIPAALREYVRARDPVCRVPGCGRSVDLDIHHLQPRSWGGHTDRHSVAMLCPLHHALAVPHGPWVLEGDPEEVDGLAWRRIDEPGHADIAARAGPAA
ncbi:MAG TPA: HNH endonuclease signature motif containing protein [Acidimicrobiia bacterium]|nr:HNH endonuclease signature motif containing protein [Acidimicrobiia bacterium]